MTGYRIGSLWPTGGALLPYGVLCRLGVAEALRRWVRWWLSGRSRRANVTNKVLLFGSLADALDGIAHPWTEQLKKRCCGTLELAHGVVQPVARRGSTIR
jgi:hypothetical protein